MPRFGGMGTAFGRMGAGGRVPAVAAGAWTTLIAPTPAGTEAGWASFTLRQGIGVAVYDAGAPATGTKIRITFLGPAAGSADVTAAYIGHVGAGDSYDFDGSQVQLTVSASGSFVIGTAATVLTDEVSFAFDKTKALVVSFAFSASASAASHQNGAAASYNVYSKAGSDAATTDATGYATSTNQVDFVTLIEVFG